MKKYLILVMVFILLLAVGCSNGSTNQSNSGNNGSGSENQSGSANSDKDQWPRGLTIATSSIGGIYHAWGGAWVNVVSNPVGIPMSIEVTGGGVDNAKLVEMKEADVGLAADGIVYAGLEGTEWTNGEKHSNLRTLFPMYPGYFQLHALTSTGIQSLQDLEGKRFVPGPAGSSADSYWRMVLDHFGIKANIINSGYADATGQMKDGLVDVIGLAPTGLPHPSTAEIAATDEVTIFGISVDEINDLQQEYPYMQLGKIPAGTYNGQDYDVDTVVLWNVMFAHKDMPESLAYEIVKATYENHEKLVSGHASAVDTVEENIKNLSVPLHPGAYKYFEEKGLTVPEQAMPLD